MGRHIDLEKDNRLTPRQFEVLTRAADGYTCRQTAAELSLSPETVSHYLKATFRKLGAVSKAQAVAIAMRRGWIE